MRIPGRQLSEAVSASLGHSNVTTTARDVNVKEHYLQELIERKPLKLVKLEECHFDEHGAGPFQLASGVKGSTKN